MKINHIDTEKFDCLEFEDVSGEYRLIRGCSLANREEFRERLSQIQKYLKDIKEEELSLQELYDKDKYFRYLCHRCLELCGVSVHWIDINMMIQMLFPYEIEGKVFEGILVDFNFPKSDKNHGAKSATYEEVLAAISTHTQDIAKALELAENVPAEQLLGTVEARAKQIQQADPKTREKAQQREWQKRARQDMERARGQ
jgi:hypothetical protein